MELNVQNVEQKQIEYLISYTNNLYYNAPICENIRDKMRLISLILFLYRMDSNCKDNDKINYQCLYELIK